MKKRQKVRWESWDEPMVISSPEAIANLERAFDNAIPYVPVSDINNKLLLGEEELRKILGNKLKDKKEL
jgi:hypothetical protein